MIIINNLNTDITNDNNLPSSQQQGLSNLLSTFCSNLATNVNNYLQNINASTIWVSLLNTGTLTSIIKNELLYWTYAYDSLTLLSWWNANVTSLSWQVAVNIGVYLNNWYNAVLLSGNNSILQTIINNNLGNNTNATSNNYNVTSALNSNSNLTISSINSNGSNQLNNMSLDTTPLQQSQGAFNNNQNTVVDGLQIANFLQQNFLNFTKTLKQVLFNVFKEYVTPLTNLDQTQRSFNW